MRVSSRSGVDSNAALPWNLPCFFFSQFPHNQTQASKFSQRQPTMAFGQPTASRQARHPGIVSSSLIVCVGQPGPTPHPQFFPMAHNKTRMSPLSAQHPFFTPIFQPKALTFLPNRDPLSPLSPTLNRTRGLFFVAIPKTFYHCSAALTVVIQLPTQDFSISTSTHSGRV